jgi:hypothetical protein
MGTYSSASDKVEGYVRVDGDAFPDSAGHLLRRTTRLSASRFETKECQRRLFGNRKLAQLTTFERKIRASLI